jgi:lipoprotein-anchoring transpeptidase ErfK/SrfK
MIYYLLACRGWFCATRMGTMPLLDIRCRDFAKVLVVIPFLALVLATSAGAESATGQHGVNPEAGTQPAQTAPAAGGLPQTKPTAAKPADATQPAAKPAEANQATAKPAEVKTPEPKPAATAANKPADPKAAESQIPALPVAKPGTPKAADLPAMPTAKPGEPKAAATPSLPEPKPGTNAAQSKPTTAAPGAEIAVPKPDGTASEPAQKEAVAAPEPVKPAGKPIIVNVDKTTQEMTVFVDGIEEHRWPVSTGTYGYTTPSGSYTASSMNEIWYSKQWDNAPMPHSVFFTKKGHAIHGSKEVKKLGTPASHGCVRLSPQNAKTLFALVKANGLENTQVVIGGETPGGEAVVASQPRYPEYGEYQPWAGQGYYPPPYGWGRRKRRGYAVAPPPGYYRPPPRRRWFQGPGAYPRY